MRCQTRGAGCSPSLRAGKVDARLYAVHIYVRCMCITCADVSVLRCGSLSRRCARPSHLTPLPVLIASPLHLFSLASNIFDWGARACVALYHDGTILDIYRAAR